jgi:hypothetical protein
MKLFLHIGAHKTGSSAFQEFLYNQRVAGGWCYPDVGLWHEDRSHNQLGIYFWDDVRPELKKLQFDQFISELLSQIGQHPHVILSSEMLEKVPARGRVDRLEYFLNMVRSLGYDVRVIYTVRRQDCIIDSIFKQWVASFDTRYCGDPIEMASEEIPHLQYNHVVENWESVVGRGNVSVVPFIEGDFSHTLANLKNAAGISPGAGPDALPRVNGSLECCCLRFKHKLNKHVVNRQSNDDILGILLRIQSDLGGQCKSTIFDGEGRKNYLTHFVLDNSALVRFFRPDAARWIGAQRTKLDVFQVADVLVIKKVISKIASLDRALYREVSRYFDDIAKESLRNDV